MKKSEPPIILKVTYPASIEKVWAALTELEKMQQWYFPMLSAFEPKVGFETKFRLEHEGRVFTHQWKVTEVIPEQKIAYDWNYPEYKGDSYVVFELSEVTDGIKLLLTNVVTKDFPQDIPEFKRESGVEGWNYLLGDALMKFLKT